jgi:hypothetical protein
VGGYVEAYYSYNFNSPNNGITAYRYLDNRHNTFVLSTAVLDVTGEIGPVSARIALQAGPVADAWYADSIEARSGAGGVSAFSASTWKHLQQAYVTYKLVTQLAIEAGLFTTCIGYEAAAVKDNWQWSRSNLFYALPFYHAGGRVTFSPSDQLSLGAWLVNGWNLASDNNDGKSFMLQAQYKEKRYTASLLYHGGPERPQSAPEGRPWRHLFDAWGQVEVLSERLWLAVHGDAGWEKNEIGLHQWVGGAGYARGKAFDFLYLALRGDIFLEDLGQSGGNVDAPIFFGVKAVRSLTYTIDVRPVDHLAFMLEYRRDTATAPLYYENTVPLDAAGAASVANATTQDTITVGATAFF